MADGSSGIRAFLGRCTYAGTSGAVWIALGVTFFVIGISRPSGAYIGLGAAFLVLGLRRVTRRRRYRQENR
jgi:hypothetical protein